MDIRVECTIKELSNCGLNTERSICCRKLFVMKPPVYLDDLSDVIDGKFLYESLCVITQIRNIVISDITSNLFLLKCRTVFGNLYDFVYLKNIYPKNFIKKIIFTSLSYTKYPGQIETPEEVGVKKN